VTEGATNDAVVRLYYDGTRDLSREAQRRIERGLSSARREERERRWRSAGGPGRLDEVLGIASRNAATASEEGGAEASRLLIYLLLMTLFMAGSVLATDMVAGEKERGTLETLFLIPSGRARIARSKLLAVGIGTALTGVLSLLSLSVSYRMGWLGEEGASALDPGALFVVGLLAIPLAVLLGAVLLAVSAYARSLKEAQYYVLPVMLVVFVPALLSMSQAVELNVLVAVLPIANVAFVMRDVLSGQVATGMLWLVVLSTILWTVLVAQRVTDLLSREETVLGFDPEPLLARTPSGFRRAAHLGMALSVLFYFYGGQWLQSRDLRWGLLASLWILLPLLGVMTWALVRPRESLAELLSLRAARPEAMIGAALLGLGMLLPMMGGLQRLLGRVLPMPEDQAAQFSDAFADMGVTELLGLAAVSPAVMEELLFRGLFLGILLRQGTVRRAVIVSAVYFALIHLSVFRVVPTFALGVLLALLVVRHRSLLPAAVLHFVYNGSLLAGSVWVEGRDLPFALDGGLAWVASVALVALGTVLCFGAPPRLGSGLARDPIRESE
jgi:sodium transport system permease protein